MNFKGKAKIAKNGRYLTTTDDLRIDKGWYDDIEGNKIWGWVIGGFAHNPDGMDRKDGSMIQSGDHYGKKNGEHVTVTFIDMPQFFGSSGWPTLDALNNDISEGVPLNTKLGFPAEHFGKHVPITFRFLAEEGLGDCVLYDIEITQFGW